MADFPLARFQRANANQTVITQLQAAWLLLSPAVQEAERNYIASLSDSEVAAISAFPVSGGAVPVAAQPSGQLIEIVEAQGTTRTVLALAFAATMVPALPTGDAIFNVGTVTSAATMDGPSGTPFDGQMVKFRFIMDGSGHVVTFATGIGAYSYGSDVLQSMRPSAANSKWEELYEYNAADQEFRAVAIVRGY